MFRNCFLHVYCIIATMLSFLGSNNCVFMCIQTKNKFYQELNKFFKDTVKPLYLASPLIKRNIVNLAKLAIEMKTVKIKAAKIK